MFVWVRNFSCSSLCPLDEIRHSGKICFSIVLPIKGLLDSSSNLNKKNPLLPCVILQFTPSDSFASVRVISVPLIKMQKRSFSIYIPGKIILLHFSHSEQISHRHQGCNSQWQDILGFCNYRYHTAYLNGYLWPETLFFWLRCVSLYKTALFLQWFLSAASTKRTTG